MTAGSFEFLGEGPQGEALRLAVNPSHRFNMDAFLLADFAEAKSKDRCVDLGAGCGILSFLLYKMYFCREIYGLEFQKTAVSLFSDSVSESGVGDRIFPVEGDLRQLPDALLPRRFDLVVCNPPYFQGSPSPDPEKAASRTEGSCTFTEVCKAARKLLRFGGRFCFSFKPERLPDAFSALRENGMEPKRLSLVADRADAVPWLSLIEGRVGGKPGLRIEPLFAVRNADGSLSRQTDALYQAPYQKARKL